MMLGAFLVSGLAGLALILIGLHALHRRRVEARLIAKFRAAHSPGHAARALAAGPTARLLVVDPTGEVLEHVAPGPGSLTTLAAVGEGRLIQITHDDLVDPEVAEWFRDAFDRPAHVPARDEAGEVDEGGVLTRWHTAIEPAMRKAHLWELRNHASHGGMASRWAELDRWRIDTPTGEYPSPFLAEPQYAAADLAEALLIS